VAVEIGLPHAAAVGPHVGGERVVRRGAGALLHVQVDESWREDVVHETGNFTKELEHGKASKHLIL